MSSLKRYAGIFGRGLMLEMAPGIAGGIIKNLFQRWQVDVAKLTEAVQQNRSLWAQASEEQQQQIKTAARLIGNLDFLTTELVIKSIKEDFPAVASMLQSWTNANLWLTRQLEDVRQKALE